MYLGSQLRFRVLCRVIKECSPCYDCHFRLIIWRYVFSFSTVLITFMHKSAIFLPITFAKIFTKSLTLYPACCPITTNSNKQYYKTRTFDQSDQIGRICAYWTVVYFGQFSVNYRCCEKWRQFKESFYFHEQRGY
jgi:hypothetical protein